MKDPLKDPLFRWETLPEETLFPYDVLSRMGIDVDSSMKQIKDIYFDIVGQSSDTSSLEKAWEKIRLIENRLYLDFFLYLHEVESLTKLSEEKINAEAMSQEIPKIGIEDMADIVETKEEDSNFPLPKEEVEFLDHLGFPARPEENEKF